MPHGARQQEPDGTMSQTLKLYSKSECPLCDEGMEKLIRVARRHGLRVEKVDITTDPELFDRFKHRIPVVTLDDDELGWGRLSERALELAISKRK